MKIGKVLEKLAQDKRVAKLDIASDSYQVSVRIAEGYYVPGGRNYQAFQTAKAAHAFIKSAKKVPAAKEGHRVVFNLMSGEPVQEPIGTPYACSVASEAYWSA